MKKIIFFLIGSLLLIKVDAQSGGNPDVVLKVNGDELKGKVTEISDTAIKFIYTGETLVYTIKKADLFKITYGSGRVELFNKQPLSSEQKNDEGASEQKASTVDHHNRVAILPFHFIADNQSAGEDMSYKVQTECYTSLSKHAGQYTILDPRTTNALLIKAGATPDKMMGFTMPELCNILGVEYIIDGTITLNKGSQQSYQSGSYNSFSGTNYKAGSNNSNVSGSSSSTTTQNYQTSIAMNIFTDKNVNIYSKDHQSFWNTNDAYKITLEYLLKRTPLYNK